MYIYPVYVSRYKRFTNLKKKDPNLKLLVSVGGWDGNPKVFSSLVSTDKNINTFAGNAINFLRSRNFDGLDVDWEFPAARGSSPSDRQRFTRMIQVNVTSKHNQSLNSWTFAACSVK